MTSPTRRTVTRTAAWTVPVIAVIGAAPAFATSQPLTCAPTAECKAPGNPNDKSYVIRTNCTSTNGGIVKVEVYETKTETWIEAVPNADGTYAAPGFPDSRQDRNVRVTGAGGSVEVYPVAFKPC
jgi:hypothetical protein